MNPESFSYKPQEEMSKAQEASPKRLMLAMELWRKAALGRMGVRGRENLQDIPRDQ